MKTIETWRPVPGYEGWYEASTLGRIRIIQRPEKGDHGIYPYVLAPLLYRKGYLKHQFCRCRGAHKPKRDFIHRIIYRTFHGPIPEGMTVNHKDGNKQNNRPENLELATNQEQVNHARRIGIGRRYNGKLAHLKADDIREIRRAYAAGERNIDLARRFRVVPGTIGHIVAGRSWRHVV